MKNISVKVGGKILKPIDQVFQAIVDKNKISNYFTSNSNADLVDGKTVTWEWEDVGAQLTVEVLKIEKDKSISFSWQATGKSTIVQIQLVPVNDQETAINISENTFELNPDDVKRAMGQTQGWTDFICCMKAYLYTGINLRTGVMKE